MTEEILLDSPNSELGITRSSPMFVRLILSLLVFLVPALSLGELTEQQLRDHTDVVGLPPCDRVEIIRLGRLAGKHIPIKGDKYGAGRWVYPKDKSNLYLIEPYNEWTTIQARTTLNGPEAEHIASLYRSFKPQQNPVLLADGRWAVTLGANCHSPPFAYRFFSGETLLYDTSICWSCRNLVVGPEGKRHYFYFDPKVPEAAELFEISNAYFPKYPVDPKHLKK